MPTPFNLYLVRHAPVAQPGVVYGNDMPIAADTPVSRFTAAAALLPDGAHWGHTGAVRTMQTMSSLMVHKSPSEIRIADILLGYGHLIEQAWGDWTGRSHKDLRTDPLFNQLSRREDGWENIPPPASIGRASESFNQFASRIRLGLDELAGHGQRMGAHDMVMVAHGGTQRAAFMSTTGSAADVAMLLRWPHLGVMKLRHDGERWRTLSLPTPAA